MIPRPLVLAIVSLVTAVWAVTITAPLWRPGAPEPHPAIHAVFMAIVGGSLALQRGTGTGASTNDPGMLTRVLTAMRPVPPEPPAVPPVESEQAP